MSKNSLSLSNGVRVSRAQKIPQTHVIPPSTQFTNKWKEGSPHEFTTRVILNPEPRTKGNSIESDSEIKKKEPIKQTHNQLSKSNITLLNGHNIDADIWSSKSVQEEIFIHPLKTSGGGNAKSQRSVLVEENWDCEELEEGKEATAGTVKVCTLNSGLSSRKFGELTMSARFPNINEFSHGECRIGLRSFNFCPNEDKCKCPKDKLAAYCKRTKGWIYILYERKGIKFEHSKYKVQYEVSFLYHG